MAEPLSPVSLSDIRAFQNEWAALRECVSPWCETDRLPKLFRDIHWSRLLLLAEEHRVLGQLAATLNDHNVPGIPPEIRHQLLECRRAQNFLTLRLTAELFRLLELFNANGIPALVIKGPVLAVQAYADPSMRTYGDLDLLVRQRDIRRATEAMAGLGYQAQIPLSAMDAGRIPGQYLFFQPDSDLLVELHNELTLRYFPRPLPLEGFFARRILVHMDAHQVPAPSLEDQLVLICVHGAKHFWERLSWIADVAGLLHRRADLDWELAGASARAVQGERLLHTGLLLAAEVLRTALPEAVAFRVKQDAVAAELAARVLRWLPAAGHAQRTLFERAVFRMRMRGGLLAGPAYFLRLALSPTEEDWHSDSNGKIRPNRFLDALRRPFRLARKYGRGFKP